MFRPGSSYSYHQVLRRFVVPASRAHVYSAAMAAAATIGPWLTGRIDLACLVGEPDEPSKPRLLEQVREPCAFATTAGEPSARTSGGFAVSSCSPRR